MTNEEFKKLKSKMPPRYREKLASKFNVSEKYIDKIFRDEANRPDIVDEAIDIAEDYQEHLSRQREKVRQL